MVLKYPNTFCIYCLFFGKGGVHLLFLIIAANVPDKPGMVADVGVGSSVDCNFEAADAIRRAPARPAVSVGDKKEGAKSFLNSF